jgi:hypothetical protein
MVRQVLPEEFLLFQWCLHFAISWYLTLHISNGNANAAACSSDFQRHIGIQNGQTGRRSAPAFRTTAARAWFCPGPLHAAQ